MTTQTITTTIGNIPSPNNWDGADCGCSESSNQNEPNVLFLEKASIIKGYIVPKNTVTQAIVIKILFTKIVIRY